MIIDISREERSILDLQIEIDGRIRQLLNRHAVSMPLPDLVRLYYRLGLHKSEIYQRVLRCIFEDDIRARSKIEFVDNTRRVDMSAVLSHGDLTGLASPGLYASDIPPSEPKDEFAGRDIVLDGNVVGFYFFEDDLKETDHISRSSNNRIHVGLYRANRRLVVVNHRGGFLDQWSVPRIHRPEIVSVFRANLEKSLTYCLLRFKVHNHLKLWQRQLKVSNPDRKKS